MKIGDEVYIHGYVDEIRKDTVIIRNDGGYFGTVEEEIVSEIPKKGTRQQEFVDLVVEYPSEDICTYPEYRGKPYFSIKYIEDGECFIGFGTYNPEVLSGYIKEYFIGSDKQEDELCEE